LFHATGRGVLLIAIACTSCERDDRPGAARPPAARAAEDAPPTSPAETIRLVQQHRQAGQFSRMEPYLAAEHRAWMIDMVRSIEQLLTANRQLQSALAPLLGEGTARRFDRSHAADLLSVFSPDAAVISEDVDGDGAVVHVQVRNTLPLLDVTLRRRDGFWQIEAEDPIRELPEQVRLLAVALTRVADEASRHGYDADQVESEMDLRTTPIVTRIAELTAGRGG